jgi:hypothetical protein
MFLLQVIQHFLFRLFNVHYSGYSMYLIQVIQCFLFKFFNVSSSGYSTFLIRAIQCSLFRLFNVSYSSFTILNFIVLFKNTSELVNKSLGRIYMWKLVFIKMCFYTDISCLGGVFAKNTSRETKNFLSRMAREI